MLQEYFLPDQRRFIKPGTYVCKCDDEISVEHFGKVIKIHLGDETLKIVWSPKHERLILTAAPPDVDREEFTTWVESRYTQQQKQQVDTIEF